MIFDIPNELKGVGKRYTGFAIDIEKDEDRPVVKIDFTDANGSLGFELTIPEARQFLIGLAKEIAELEDRESGKNPSAERP